MTVVTHDYTTLIAEAGRLAETQRLDEALAILEPMRGHPDIEFRRGGLLMLQDRFAEAEAAYRLVMQANPKHLDTAVNFALSLIEQGKAAGAIPYLEAAIRAQPDTPRFHYLLGVALDEAGRTKEGNAELATARGGVIGPAERRDFVPWEVYVQVSRRCNLRCAMCGYQVWESNAGLMDDAVFTRVLDECQTNNVRMLHILAGQGEPFLHPKILDLLEQATARGLAVGIVTNGTPLTAERIARLSKIPLAYFQFSFAGWDKASYEATYVGAKFEKALTNLKAVDKAFPPDGPTNFFVKAVAAGDWETTFRKTKAFLAGEGVERVFTVVANNFGGTVECGKFNERHQIWSQKRITHHRLMPCRVMLKAVGVFCDGTITACGCYDSNARLKIGHIMEQGLAEIRKGAAFQRILEAFRAGDVSAIPMCQGCDDPFG